MCIRDSHDTPHVGQLLHVAYQRNHDLRMDDVAGFLGDLDGGLDNRLGLHLGEAVYKRQGAA